MPAYRIYWLDQDDHITEADCLIGEADDNARGNLRASRNGRSRRGVAQGSPRRAGHTGLPANPTPLIRADTRRGRGHPKLRELGA